MTTEPVSALWPRVLSSVQINVFVVLHKAFVRWGLPKAMLSDRGSQFKASQLYGEAEYQYLMRRLGIELIYRKRPSDQGEDRKSVSLCTAGFCAGESSSYLFGGSQCGLGEMNGVV